MTRFSTALMQRTRLHLVVAALAALGLGACSNSPFAPTEDGASMQVGATAMTATTLGESITIDAAVVTAAGARVPNAEIHWEVSAPDVLEPAGNGRFRVLREGSVQVVAVWPRDPSVRALVTVKVDASVMVSACVARTDQMTGTSQRRCAQRRVVVSAAGPTTLASNSNRVPGGGR
jgi:hypothetical protein